MSEGYLLRALADTQDRGPLRYNRNTVKAWAGDSQWRACRADWARFRKAGYCAWGSEGFWALVLHRLQKVVRQRRPGWLWTPARLALRVVRKLFVIVTLIDIHPQESARGAPKSAAPPNFNGPKQSDGSSSVRLCHMSSKVPSGGLPATPSSAPNMHTCCELEWAPRSKRTFASPPHQAQLRLGSKSSTWLCTAGAATANSRQPA